MEHLKLQDIKSRYIVIGSTALLVIALVAALVVSQLSARASNHENPEIQPAEAQVFTNDNTFTDDVRAEIRLKYGEPDETGPGRSGDAPPHQPGGRETFERLVNDASNMAMLSLTFAPEENGTVGGVDWHTHPGPLMVAVAEGALTVTWSNDCEPRTYEAGEAFVDLGEIVHKAENFSGEETVVYIAGFGIPEGEPVTNVVADDEDFVEPCQN
ncbi:MAG: hypothetical protein ACOC9Y_00445 [Chloroflexota bacterium]